MAKKVEIKKTVFNASSYADVIDRKFKFFKEPDPIVDTDTVEELFRLYDKLYITIPINGQTQSHQYLVERSSELYQVDSQLDAIQPLLDEVASLRGQILEANRQILELETKLAGGGDIDFEGAAELAALRVQLTNANNTIASLQAQGSVDDVLDASSDAQADANARAAEAEAKAERDKKVGEVTMFVSVDRQKEMTSIINWSSRARRRKKRRRLDNRRDTKKVNKLILELENKFKAPDYPLDLVLEGIKATPIKNRVNFQIQGNKLTYTLIRM